MTAETAPEPQSQMHWFLIGARGLFSLPAIILMLSFVGFAAFTAEAKIPVGQVMARLVSEAEGQGGIAELKSRKDLFATTPEGKLDPIHPNDLGIYLVALTHYAVLYGKSPVGLPHELRRADGTPATAPSPELARRMQETVWDVVTAIPEAGVPPGGL